MYTNETPVMSDLRVAIENVRVRGRLIHGLPPFATQKLAEGNFIHGLPQSEAEYLAENRRIYTTTTQRDPGTFAEFYPTWRREQYMRQIAHNVGTVLGESLRFRESVANGVLDEHLVTVFNSIDDIECSDVHWNTSYPVPKGQIGIATATTTHLHVPDAEYAKDIVVAAQGMLRTLSLGHFYPVYQESRKVVVIENLDEHAARSLSRQQEAVVAQADKKRGVTLPPDKSTYEDWKERGETFIPHTDLRLQNASAAYSRLGLHGTYRNRPDLQPRPWPCIIGTDAAAFMEGIRDILNGLIHDKKEGRGSGRLNLEQHPIKQARPLVELGVDLRRRKITLADIANGPPSAYPPNVAQRGLDSGQEWIQAARRNPLRTIAEGVSSAVSLPATVFDIAGAAIKLLPSSTAKIGGLIAAHKEWERRKEAAAAGGERLDKIVNILRRTELGLPIWENDY